MTGRTSAVLFFVAATLVACTPRIMTPGPVVQSPTLAADAFVAADGARLPVRSWLPKDKARAVIVAAHGFNDYSAFFATPGPWFADRGIAAYAFDQRGFGQGPHPGLWAGWRGMVADLRALVGAVKARHGDAPVYVLGESMGGAVAMGLATAADGKDAPATVAGYILSGPAVWGRDTMPFYQVAALWASAHVVPWMTVTGRGLDIWASDNIDMLRALGRDDLVIKETRTDAIWGLVNLMDQAQVAAGTLDARTLVLYGERDEVIPPSSFRALAAALNPAPVQSRTVALYREGWHMLLRDLQAETVWRDIAAWIDVPTEPLPSGGDVRAKTCLGPAPLDDCWPARINPMKKETKAAR